MAYNVKDTVPVSVLSPLIKEWITKYLSGCGHTANPYVESGDEGALSVLSFHCRGLAPRTLRGIMNENLWSGGKGNRYQVDYVSFDTADKIVCGTVGPLAWITEPALAEHYGPFDVTYSELVKGYELPEGYDFDALPTARKRQWRVAQEQAA